MDIRTLVLHLSFSVDLLRLCFGDFLATSVATCCDQSLKMMVYIRGTFIFRAIQLMIEPGDSCIHGFMILLPESDGVLVNSR